MASTSARTREPEPVRRVHRLRMASRREAIPPTVERVLKLVRGARLSRPQRDDLAVALAEALANAAVHGNGLREGSRVEVRVEVSVGRGVRLLVKDQGRGFDYEAVPDPSEPGNLLVPRGRGVFLMRRLMDAVEFSKAGNQVELSLRRRRNGDSPPAGP